MKFIMLPLIAVVYLGVVACGPMPVPNSDPAAATKALTDSGYTDITNVRPLNSFDVENCTQEEALYCNYFEANDRRGIRVSGTIVEEIDGELEIDHND